MDGRPVRGVRGGAESVKEERRDAAWEMETKCGANDAEDQRYCERMPVFARERDGRFKPPSILGAVSPAFRKNLDLAVERKRKINVDLESGTQCQNMAS